MTRTLSLFCALVASLMLVGCEFDTATNTPATNNNVADLVLTNAKVYTMDKQRSWAEAVAIKDGRIVFVGKDTAVASYVGVDTQQIDLQGKMVLPSFQDVHIHPVSAGVAYRGCVLFDAETQEEMLAIVASCVKESPDAAYIRGTGWSWSIFIGSSPHKDALDAIDSTRPIILGDSDGHTLWGNSAAMALAGITVDTPQPEGGEIGLDDNGELDGTLLETAMDMLESKLPVLTLQQKEDGLRYSQNYLHGLGITSIQDAYVRLLGEGADKSLDAYKSLQDKGELNLRVVAALYWEPGIGMSQIDGMVAARQNFSKGRLQATSIKFWADGILESHTAKMLEPYSDKPDSNGLLMIPREEIMEAVPALDALGFQIHVHAIGDATVRYALDAFEAAQKANGKRDSRHLTAHTQLVDEADLNRFAELDAIAGFSPYWANADSYVAEINPAQIGPERMKRMYLMKSILDSGARIAFGSDWYVTTADPLLGIETAVTRLDPEDAPTPEFLPAERLSLDQAIAGYTTGAAHANFLDKDTGTVEVGKYADLVVLTDNLFEVPAEQISNARVTATIMEGELVFGEL